MTRPPGLTWIRWPPRWPSSCPHWGWGGASYYSCGGSFYQPIYEGDTVVYVTVEDPSKGQQAPGPVEPPGEDQGPPAP